MFDIRYPLLLALLCVFAAPRETIAASGKPNIVVILVDDLVTTGETARACLEALREANPASVRVLCAGRKRGGKNEVERFDSIMFE